MTPDDRTDMPIDYRYLQLLLDAAWWPRFWSPSRSGSAFPRIPASYPRKKKWSLLKQMDPLDYLEEQSGGEAVWRQNYSSLEAYTDKVLEVMHDQAKRGQVLRLSEEEAKKMFPNLTVASSGAQRKEKAGGAVTARVLFDGTHGIAVNHQTRIRDQERGPIASDIKRIMREKSKSNEATFALTADVTEAHRQVPISRQDWHLLGCQVQLGGDVFVNTVGTFGVASASYCWSRVASAVGRPMSVYPRSIGKQRGTCLLRTTTTWMQVVQNIVLLLFVSSSFAVFSLFRCRGERRPVETRCHGWVSNFCTGLTR